MNCQNCKHWVFNKCAITGNYITADKLCNGWELSVSFDQAQKSNSVPENVTELKDTIIRLKSFVDELIELGNMFADDRIYQDDLVDSWHDLVRDYKAG